MGRADEAGRGEKSRVRAAGRVVLGEIRMCVFKRKMGVGGEDCG